VYNVGVTLPSSSPNWRRIAAARALVALHFKERVFQSKKNLAMKCISQHHLSWQY
jgi:hypothetical protein